MNDQQRQFLMLLAEPPARLTVEQTAWLLNCQVHDIPILVAARLLKPVGNPPVNGQKFFAAAEIRRLAGDPSWLARMTNATLPVKAEQMDSLLDVFRRAPDPRDTNTRYRIGPVLTLIAMALLAGRREIAEIARFATTLTPPQRRRLNLPLKQGTKRFYQVPGYDVFYQVLTRMDPEAFATTLTSWLQQHHGQLPAALALDGKMIRNHIGLLTLAQHEDGAPQAVAVYDQKENTERCEQTAAAALLEKLPALDGKLITADPLHCQRGHARRIVEKGGDYLFGVKGNQPKLLERAQQLDALKDTPFLPRAKVATAG